MGKEIDLYRSGMMGSCKSHPYSDVEYLVGGAEAVTDGLTDGAIIHGQPISVQSHLGR